MPIQEVLLLSLKALSRSTVRYSTRIDEQLRDEAILAIEGYLKTLDTPAPAIEPESVIKPKVKLPVIQ